LWFDLNLNLSSGLLILRDKKSGEREGEREKRRKGGREGEFQF
jgi:hypothetical protein